MSEIITVPCKVGDKVYCELNCYKGIQEFEITNIMITQNKKGIWTKKYRAMLLLDGKIVSRQINFAFDEIGKTVFLNREEAEVKEGAS